MKPWIHFLLLLSALPLRAEEKPADPPTPPVETRGTKAWAGLQVGPIPEPMRAHLPNVPQGIGFVVVKVTPDGPAHQAGLRAFDVLWKMGDQWLVNEAQFGTLLRLRAVGEKVDFTVVRRGEEIVAGVTLAEMPEDAQVTTISPIELPLVPPGVPGMPKTVVYPQSREAELSREDGSTARLKREDDGYSLVIRDAEGEVVYEGPVKRDDGQRVPDEWRCSVGVLIRALHRSEHPDWQPRPRPRVVVPPTGQPSDKED